MHCNMYHIIHTGIRGRTAHLENYQSFLRPMSCIETSYAMV
jgi:hypothetical protein